MSKALDELTRVASELTPDERLAAARHLLQLDASSNGGDSDVAWEEEIQARIKAIDEGRALGIPYEEVLARINQRLGS